MDLKKKLLELGMYLLEKGFEREEVDRTLFIYRAKTRLVMAQIYVDDIAFEATYLEQYSP